MAKELNDDQCDKLVEDVFKKLAATYDSEYGAMNPKDLNPDILEHDSLRRAIVREAYALGHQNQSFQAEANLQIGQLPESHATAWHPFKYTAAQMRSYAEQEVAAEREKLLPYVRHGRYDKAGGMHDRNILLEILAQEVRLIATHGSTPDGDAVNTSTLLWAEEWARRLSTEDES